jgi:FkbM family methyltransferase
MSVVKDLLRELFILLHVDVTQNIKYDRLTRKIIRKILLKNHNCIDIGCHKGEILDLIIKFAPDGNHFAFEPIPYLFKDLEFRYAGKATILPYALSDKIGNTSFQLVKNAPAYSGIKRRKYDINDPEIEEINVEMNTLDCIIGDNTKIDFIKIDVEGGEFSVLKGAKKILHKYQPVILFECGKGASDYYGTLPEDIFYFITNEIEMNICTMDAFLRGDRCLSKEKFVDFFNTNKEYYFVACKM